MGAVTFHQKSCLCSAYMLRCSTASLYSAVHVLMKVCTWVAVCQKCHLEGLSPLRFAQKLCFMYVCGVCVDVPVFMSIYGFMLLKYQNLCVRVYVCVWVCVLVCMHVLPWKPHVKQVKPVIV